MPAQASLQARFFGKRPVVNFLPSGIIVQVEGTQSAHHGENKRDPTLDFLSLWRKVTVPCRTLGIDKGYELS
jgi:hypothetical protein